MVRKQKNTLALFYCQNVPESSDEDRKALEKKYGPSIRLFPIPCSGRLEPVMAVWMPNILFVVISIFLYRLAPK